MQSHSFSDFGLSKSIVQAVAAEGYETPTEIQSQAIPVLMRGDNLLGTAQTGTGKTAAFALPLLHRLGTERTRGDAAGQNARRSSQRSHRPDRTARPQALILAPTRELAIQIDTAIATYGNGSGVSHQAVYGGAPKGRQLEKLRRGPVVLVATPGRLDDFIGDGAIDLADVKYLIIDEADRMLDMGFLPTVRNLVARISNRDQTALFSATMPKEIERFAGELLGRDAQRIAIAPQTVTADGIKQSVLHMRREDKVKMLPILIRDRNMFRVLVFTRTKHRAARVAKVLRKEGIPSDEIHGNRSQNQRQRALESFRRGRVQVLVGTDVASRGIDVDDITHVINYEIPNEPETYVHRIGRTARAGTTGEAINFCDNEELAQLRDIERLLKGAIPVDRDHESHLEPPQPRGKSPRPNAHVDRDRRGGNRHRTTVGKRRGTRAGTHR